MRTSFLVVRSKDNSDATVRLQSDAVLRGLTNLSDVSVQLVDPSKNLKIENGACILFHFDDLPAIKFLRESRDEGRNFLAACFGSDIYEFSRYLPSDEIADLYLMPTELHRKVLASEFYKPVYYFAEGLDPIAIGDENAPQRFPIKESSRLLWFGYSESFNKSMASLIPILKLHLESARIQSFSLILNEGEFSNDFNFHTISFRNDSFRSDARAFDYCILSHFSLDLSLNSYIKSPNKLLTALFAGLIPIASDTPSYSKILCEFGLENFLFDSPAKLDRILRNVDPVRDSQQIVDSGIIEALWKRCSAINLAQELLAITAQFDDLAERDTLHLRPFILPPKQPNIYFTEHLKDLLPSLRRAVRSRLSGSKRPK